MIELVAGIIGMILLYFLGHFLYPEPKQKEIVPEPGNWISKGTKETERRHKKMSERRYKGGTQLTLKRLLICTE